MPVPTPSNNGEPALTAAGAAAAIIGLITLVATRVNRSFDFLNPTEFSDLRTWLSLAAPIGAAVWVRRHVTTNKRVEEKVQFSVAAGYAQGLEDQPAVPAPPPVVPAPVKLAKAKAAEKKKP